VTDGSFSVVEFELFAAVVDLFGALVWLYEEGFVVPVDADSCSFLVGAKGSEKCC
jgi:hypothetical protein